MTEVKGCLFPNQKGPVYKGFIEIDGKRTNIVAWNRNSNKDGKPFLGLSFDAPRDDAARQPQQERVPGSVNTKIDMDDEIPF
jgi:hypothetical protein